MPYAVPIVGFEPPSARVKGTLLEALADFCLGR